MQAVVRLTTAAARAMSVSDQAECRLVTQSLPMIAACLTASYKELPASALSCLDVLLGESVYSLSPSSFRLSNRSLSCGPDMLVPSLRSMAQN